jgi:hypothetical protein
VGGIEDILSFSFFLSLEEVCIELRCICAESRED